MPRIKIDLPERFVPIAIKIPVRITDINYGNHLGNDSLVSIIHEARVQFLQHFNYTELNIEGVGLLLANIFVEYKKESFYKDIIEVRIAIGEVSRSSFELFYKLLVVKADKEIIIANAKTTMICYDYTLKKVRSIPEKFKQVLTD